MRDIVHRIRNLVFSQTVCPLGYGITVPVMNNFKSRSLHSILSVHTMPYTSHTLTDNIGASAVANAPIH